MTKFVRKTRKNESVEDPRELLLSLVDMGSLDSDELLLACVKEMSDAECKRVLNSLSLPDCCGECEDMEEPEEDDLPEDLEPVEPVELEEEPEEGMKEDDIAEVEARIRRLEKALKERCGKNEEDEEEVEDEDEMNETDRCRTEARIRRLERMLNR